MALFVAELELPLLEKHCTFSVHILGFKQASDISSPVESLYNLSAPISNTFSVGVGYEF